MLKLSIIIINWNTKHLLFNCLNSIFNTLDGKTWFEVWVVDNASKDSSAEMVKKDFRQVNLIENKENVGFSRANNQVIPLTNGEYVLFLNSDTVVLSEAIEYMIAFLDSNPEAGICGANLLTEDFKPNMSYSYFPTIRSEIIREIRPLIFGKPPKRCVDSNLEEPFAVDYVLGAAMMIRRETLNSVGLFDEDFFFYAEDVDLCLRARKKGWKIFCLPKAKIIHLFGKSSIKEHTRFELEFYKSRNKFFQKHYGNTYGFCWRLSLSLCKLWQLIPVLLNCLTHLLKIKNNEILTCQIKLLFNIYRFLLGLSH
ncbi:MAG: glycosyltransferase family 2 protein [Candidatus Omnitrophica bacterium]|nr:glycosyltransferase family 2 protein [Candidatus Omnitrophota bacterium]